MKSPDIEPLVSALDGVTDDGSRRGVSSVSDLRATLLEAVAGAPIEDLPALAGVLAEARARIDLRILGASPRHQKAEPLLSVPEIALKLGMSRSSVYELIDRGEIHALRAGTRRVRVEPSELERYITLRRTMGTR